MPIIFKFNHKVVVILFLSFLMIPPIDALSQKASDTLVNPKDIIFSFTFKNEPLIKVLEKISEATCYKINVDKEWMDVLVTASLKNVKIHESLKELFRNLNHAIIINDAERELSIIICGAISPLKRQVKVVTPGYKTVDLTMSNFPAPDLRQEKKIDPSVSGLPAPDLQQKKQIDPFILGLPVPDFRQKKQIDPHKLGLPTPYSSHPKSEHDINRQPNGEKIETKKIGG